MRVSISSPRAGITGSCEYWKLSLQDQYMLLTFGPFLQPHSIPLFNFVCLKLDLSTQLGLVILLPLSPGHKDYNHVQDTPGYVFGHRKGFAMLYRLASDL